MTNVKYRGNDIYTMTPIELSKKYFVTASKATRDKRKITSVYKEIELNKETEDIVLHNSIFNIGAILLIGIDQAKELRGFYGLNYYNKCFEGVRNEDLMYCTPYLCEKYNCNNKTLNSELSSRGIKRDAKAKLRNLDRYVDVSWSSKKLMAYTKCNKEEAKKFLEELNINCGILEATNSELINTQTSILSEKYKCSCGAVYQERKLRGLERYKVDIVKYNFKMSNFFHHDDHKQKKTWQWNKKML